jgi:hypothetical protein
LAVDAERWTMTGDVLASRTSLHPVWHVWLLLGLSGARRRLPHDASGLLARRWLRRPSELACRRAMVGKTANQQEANMSTSTATPTIVLIHGRLQNESKAITAFKEFPERPHFTLGVDSWEEVADYALHWALNPTPSVEGL